MTDDHRESIRERLREIYSPTTVDDETLNLWTQTIEAWYSDTDIEDLSPEYRDKEFRSAETVVKLARALGVEPGELLAGIILPKAQAPHSPEGERREEELEDMDLAELIELHQELTKRRDEVARAIVRKGPYTETPLSERQRERRERVEDTDNATGDTAETA